MDDNNLKEIEINYHSYYNSNNIISYWKHKSWEKIK